MVAVAGLLTLLFGLPIALLLIVTGRGGVCEAQAPSKRWVKGFMEQLRTRR